MLGSTDPVGIQQLRRTYKYFKDYRQVRGALGFYLLLGPFLLEALLMSAAAAL